MLRLCTMLASYLCEGQEDHKPSVKTLLFVCSGNTCRSPLALAAWQALTPRREVQVQSAGLWARDGAPAAAHSQAIAQEWGVDLSCHRARTLTDRMVARADWICVMTSEQAGAMRQRFRPTGAVVLLGSFAPSSQQSSANRIEEIIAFQKLLGESRHRAAANNIIDPFGGSREAYLSCAAQIRSCVENMARVLIDDDGAQA